MRTKHTATATVQLYQKRISACSAKRRAYLVLYFDLTILLPSSTALVGGSADRHVLWRCNKRVTHATWSGRRSLQRPPTSSKTRLRPARAVLMAATTSWRSGSAGSPPLPSTQTRSSAPCLRTQNTENLHRSKRRQITCICTRVRRPCLHSQPGLRRKPLYSTTYESAGLRQPPAP